jgi:hypothetical protein
MIQLVITSAQIRAARALLRWGVADLASSSGIGSATIKRLEAMEGVPSANLRTVTALQEALERAGIEFIGSPTDGPGVRLRTTP